MTAPSFSLRGSIAARLALGYGLLVALSMAAIAAVLYVGTVGVFERSIDAKITSVAEQHNVAFATQAGADGYIVKPSLNATLLKQAIDDILMKRGLPA